MSDIQAIKESGLIEAYCLGQLQGESLKSFVGLLARNPELENEVRRVQLAFSGATISTQPTVNEDAKAALFAKIRNLDLLKKKPEYLPELISKFACPVHWKAKVSHLEFPENPEAIHLIPILEEAKTVQFLARVEGEVPEEMHSEMVESFLVLQGSGICRIGNEQINLSPGEFLEIPLHTLHSIQVTSHEPIIAILQRISL